MSNQNNSKYQHKDNFQSKPNFFQLIAKSYRTYYLNKCYPLIKLFKRSFWFSFVLLALKSVLLLLTNVDLDIKNYLDKSQSTSISAKIDSINYNINNSYRQSILQFILVINVYILLILAIEFFISLSNTFKSSVQIFSITEDEESEINTINSINENQKESQFFNRSLTTYKILSLLLQCYPYIIYIPSLSISLQNLNFLSYINLPITIIINLFVSLHEFNYEFSQERDYLARRNYWSQMVIFILDTTTICVLQLQSNSSVLLGINISHFFVIAVYEYYYVPIIQNTIQYFSLGIYVMQFFVTAQILFNKQLSVNADNFLSFFVIAPLSWKIGYNLAQYRISSIVTKNHQKFKDIYKQMGLTNQREKNILHSNQTNINSPGILQFEIYIRFLLDNLKCFFDDFSNSQYGILLQDIIELHKENCFESEASSCFCRIVNKQEDIDRNQFLDKKWRFQFLNSYITDLFVYSIQKLQRAPLSDIEREHLKNRYFYINEQANILKFQFISYLIEIQRNETLAFKELLSLGKDICSEIDQNQDMKDVFNNKESKNKTKQTVQLSLRDQLIVRYLYQRSLYSFKFQQQIHLRNKQHEKYMLFSIMSFDEKMHIAQEMLRNCIEDKSILIKNLSQSEINIEQVFQDGLKLRKQRRDLMKMLKQLINLNSYCSQLEEMCQFFDSTINFDLSLLKVLKKKKERESESSNSKRKQIFFTIQKFYSPDSTVAFVSLMGKVGKIVKVSNNFSQIIPNFTNKENSILGSSINCMIPPQLQAAHDAILQDFGKQEIMQTALKDLPLIIGVDKNGFSVPYSLKLQTYHDIINHELGICAWIKRLNLNYQNHFQDVQFINANLNQNASIINASQHFFEQVIHTHFHQRDIHTISLFSMIPALEGIIKDYQQKQEIENHSKLVGEIYETLLVEVKQDQKQANWMKQPHRASLIKQISKLQLHWVQMEVSIVKNKYMNILQIQIKSMRNLHNTVQNLTNSFDNSNNLSLKIEGIKSLCLQLISICEWSQEEIQSQLVDIQLEDCSPINRQISQRQNQASIDITPSNRKGSLNSSSLNQYRKYQSIQFGSKRKFSNQDKEYELIHLKEVKQVDEEEEHLEKNYNLSINKISFPSLPQIPLTNRENQSLVDLLRSDRGLSFGEEINQINVSNNNIFLKKQPSFQEEKNDNFQSNPNISSYQEIKQTNKLNINNFSIEYLAFSPNNNDYSPFYQLSNSITQNQVSTMKNILHPHRQSINSFPHGSNLINHSTSIEKNTSKEDSSPAIVKTKIFNSIKRNKQGQQVDYESSVNSSKTSHDGLKREIISKIKSQKKIRILIGINVIGIITIIGLYLLNIYNFTSLNYLLSNEKTAFHLIDWCSQLRLSYAYSLSDMYLLVMMQLKIVQFTSMQQFSEYKQFALQRLNSSYQTYKQLMVQYTNQDKNQVDVFNTILNTNMNVSVYSTPTSFYNITMSLDYALITQLGNIAMYATLNDKTQIHQINANQNYEGLINHLTLLQTQNNNQYDNILNSIYNDQMNQMIYVLVTTFIISLSVLPTFSFIQIKRQEILKLLSTFSPEKLKLMMANLLKSRQRINEMLMQQKISNTHQYKNNQASFNESTNKKKKGQQSTAVSQNDDDLFFLAQTQIQKKRNISSIKPLNKLNIKLLIWVLVFFVFMQVYSVLILYFVSNFKKNSTSNRTIMNALTETKSQISAQFAMNQVMNIVILAPQLVPPPYDLYFGRAYYLSNLTSQVLTDLYNAQQEVHSFDRYQQDQFNSFLRPVFEKNACNTLEKFPLYTFDTNFNYSQCTTVQDGQLNYGLINAVKQMTVLLTQQVDLFKINNKKLYIQQLNIFQQQNNFYILDLFRNQIDSTINSSLTFMNHVSDNLFDYMITANIILISIQSFAVLIIIVFGWFRYYSQIQTLLLQTKYVLDLFEVQILMDNSYIVTYLKKSL
ncbi:transmembrane protein, putative (macronuclear) [Tetrahymena thermophila SB210]|uniref:Transmembrane protein, putative n=1 Tax=Tetrahymena thermophila (strain SB210) TaxID=312017 RepID=I7M6X7_TETTS|nr:transmembrane protein, putative [Tetrahymena thermophila SB210]EAR87453.2 transmembrane protein, putative [Tetrahymena thermophila SB210]|eukprot:XP_001007698.2 transmembrane protein, putative [Tetrahymena thermophila SB210]